MRRHYHESVGSTAVRSRSRAIPLPNLDRQSSCSSLNASSSSVSSRKVRTSSGTDVMIDPSSPCGTPQRKKWEGAFNSFLKGKNPQHPSPSSSPSSSITSIQIGEDLSTGTAASAASSSGTTLGMKGSKKKSSFSLIPGSKRLVSRNTSALTSIFSKGNGSSNGYQSQGSRINRRHKSMDALDIPLRKGMEKSKPSARPNGTSISPTRYALTMRQRSTPITSTEAAGLHFPSSVAESCATDAVNRINMRREEEPRDKTPESAASTASFTSSLSGTPPTQMGVLDEQIRASAISNNSVPARKNSHFEQTSSVEVETNEDDLTLPLDTVSAPSLSQLHGRKSQSRTYVYTSNSNSSTPVKLYQQNHDQLDLRLLPEFPSLNPNHRVPSLDNLDVGLNLDESDNSHMEESVHLRQDQLVTGLHAPQNIRHRNHSNGHNSSCPTIIMDHGIQEPPESLDDILGGISGELVTVHSSLSSQHLRMLEKSQLSISPETKKAFTKIHNSSEYGQDSMSPFLGGTRASNIDLAGAYRAYAQHSDDGPTKTQFGSIPRWGSLLQQQKSSQENLSSSSNVLSRSLPTDSNGDQGTLSSSGRLLKPIQSAEAWVQGRRYLIAPAALAACPTSTIERLTGSVALSVSEAATSGDPPRASGAIDLGDCFMTYVGEKYHLTFGKWSSCKLVLRQNYLLEYDLGTSLTSLPRGIAHLQHATAHLQPDFQDALELHFYASPCAKLDHRVLLIRVKNKEERDHWITCLNRAARLCINDLWDYQEDNPLGSGRYASIYSACRKMQDSLGEQHFDKEHGTSKATDRNCALKVIDKKAFWSLVIKGRERCDTIVREIAVQSTLTAKFGSKPTFLQIHGFFETSEKIVIELELLEGKDLFEYISSKGVLEEEEAALIIQDVLVALNSMNRAGIAHRDIKPANILMTKCDDCKFGNAVKIGDFGMSTLVGADGLLRGRCGSPGYVAPEIFKAEAGQGYGNQVDIFSAGVTLYLMLCGYEPFYGETEKELIKANKKAELEFPKCDWGKISTDARDLVARMLRKDPKKRITPKDALEHKWFAQFKESSNLNLISARGDFDEAAENSTTNNNVCAIM